MIALLIGSDSTLTQCEPACTVRFHVPDEGWLVGEAAGDGEGDTVLLEPEGDGLGLQA